MTRHSCQHARVGAMNLKSQTCGNETCSRRRSYGLKGSRKAEYCAQHAMAGMVDVTTKKCGYEGCPKVASFALDGSRKAEYCTQHARAGMVCVRSQKCSYEGCLTQASFGLRGSRKTEYCAKHARVGMVNVRSNKCGNKGCSTQASFGLEGSRKAEYCAQHARADMINVRSNKCGSKGCSSQASFGLRGSRKIEYCAKHAGVSMVNVRNNCSNEGYSAQASLELEGIESCSKQVNHQIGSAGKGKFCMQYARVDMTTVSDALPCAHERGEFNGGLTQHRVGRVAANHAGVLYSPSNRISSGSRERGNTRRDGTGTRLLSGQAAGVTDVASGDSEEPVKLELHIAPPLLLGREARKHSDPNSPSSTSSGDSTAKRARCTVPTVSGDSPAGSESTPGEDGVKMELGISGSPRF